MKANSFVMYMTALVCVFCGVAALFFSPDLYKMSHLHLGPSFGLLFAVGGTLALDAAGKA